MMVRLSTTCPIEADEVSSSGVSALTLTLCDACPTSIATLIAT